jgi:hypothetical protein
MRYTQPRLTEILSLAALLTAAVLLAAAWSDGPAPTPCQGDAAPNAAMLFPAVLSSGIAALISLIGAATARGRHVWVAGVMLLSAIALGVGALFSIGPLIPCFGE